MVCPRKRAFIPKKRVFQFIWTKRKQGTDRFEKTIPRFVCETRCRRQRRRFRRQWQRPYFAKGYEGQAAAGFRFSRFRQFYSRSRRAKFNGLLERRY